MRCEILTTQNKLYFFSVFFQDFIFMYVLMRLVSANQSFA